METKNNYEDEQRYIAAQKKVKKLKDFHRHLFWYVLVNLFISTFKVKGDMERGESFNEAFFNFGTFAIWIFWGIAIVMQAWNVYGKNLVFSKDWERRKIQEFVDNDDNY